MSIVAGVDSSISMVRELQACGAESGMLQTPGAVRVWKTERRGGQKIGMKVRDVSGPCPSGAVAIMGPAVLPARRDYPAGTYPVGSVVIRSRPGPSWCGEALR